MSIELQSSIATQNQQSPSTTVRASIVGESRAVASEISAARIDPQRPVENKSLVAADQQIEEVVEKAASAMFKGREVEVNGFLHDDSGRFVYRISDKASGELLAQTPPDALLRFYASYQGLDQPLVSVDA